MTATEDNNLAPATKARRISIDLKAPAGEEVDRLKEMTGMTTADLFRYAFTLLRMYVNAKTHDGDMRVVEPGKDTKVIELPFFVAPTKG